MVPFYHDEKFPPESSMVADGPDFHFTRHIV
jgi:hypothetical protein